MQQADSHRMDFCEMPFMKLSLKYVDTFQFCLKSGKIRKNFKWKPASFCHLLPGLVFVTETMFPRTYCYGLKSIWRKRIEQRALMVEHQRFYVNAESRRLRFIVLKFLCLPISMMIDCSSLVKIRRKLFCSKNQYLFGECHTFKIIRRQRKHTSGDLNSLNIAKFSFKRGKYKCSKHAKQFSKL